jgi:hypothetical protein
VNPLRGRGSAATKADQVRGEHLHGHPLLKRRTSWRTHGAGWRPSLMPNESAESPRQHLDCSGIRLRILKESRTWKQCGGS